MNLFKRKPKEETVSREAHNEAVDHWYYKYMDAARDLVEIEADRDSYREDALKYRANIARLHEANARRKARAREKQEAGHV